MIPRPQEPPKPEAGLSRSSTRSLLSVTVTGCELESTLVLAIQGPDHALQVAMRWGQHV